MRKLDTARLVVRPFEEGDLEDCIRVFGDADDIARSRRKAWLSWQTAGYEQMRALRQPPYGDRAIVRKSDHALIGVCGLVPSLVRTLVREKGRWRFGPRFSPEVGLFYALHEEARGEGFATEAARALIDLGFGELELARIIATTSFDNNPSLRVMERLGLELIRNRSGEPAWLQVVGVRTP
jgi:RimJ/RimL family protein N-acetyltransferase